jgi:hypothetical protein
MVLDRLSFEGYHRGQQRLHMQLRQKEAIMATVNYDLVFDGEDDYIEIPDSADFSVAATGQFSVSAWARPDVLTFPVFQGTGYVHLMGKGL